MCSHFAGRLSSENLQKSIMYTLCSKVPRAEAFRSSQAVRKAKARKLRFFQGATGCSNFRRVVRRSTGRDSRVQMFKSDRGHALLDCGGSHSGASAAHRHWYRHLDSPISATSVAVAWCSAVSPAALLCLLGLLSPMPSSLRSREHMSSHA